MGARPGSILFIVVYVSKVTKNMESEQIFKWCDDKGIDVKKCIVLNEVSFDVTDETIYKVLDDAKIFGRSKVRGRCQTHSGLTQAVLVETTNDMTKADIPEQLVAGDQSELWVVSVHDTQSTHVPVDKGSFQSKLASFLASEGKTLNDVTGLLSPTPAPPTVSDLNTELVNAISSLVEKMSSPAYGRTRLS